ncbi:DUF2948 family protein [Parapedomonas caeni]
MAPALRLLAQSVDDVAVISALVQDAAVLPAEVAFDPRARRLVLLMNRYRWEEKRPAPTRVRAALRIEGVLKAQRRDWPAEAAATAAIPHVLDLLAVTVEPGADEAAALALTFAGGPAIRLEVECLDLVLEDLTDPWIARVTPAHD